jgi:hypothetical protein
MKMSGAEVSKKPEDSAFKQQRLPSWQPVLTPLRIIIVFMAIGILFLPIGVSLRSESDSLTEQVYDYTGHTGTEPIQFKIKKDTSGPIYVYYQLSNYYQNHRRYVQSRNSEQLTGVDVSKNLLVDCEPMVTNSTTGNILNPCGLIANSFFTDKLTNPTVDRIGQADEELTGNTNGSPAWDETGIAWKSDLDRKFDQPNGFVLSDPLNVNNASAAAAACVDIWDNVNAGIFFTSIKYEGPYHEKGYYCYYYPNDDNIDYLHELYPNNISPVDGVLDEHFIVWMRTAALPKFRKLYAVIDRDFKKGEILKIDIEKSFEVESYNAKKAIVIATLGTFGGKNSSLGISYIVVGSISLLLALAFFIKHVANPRRMGDFQDLKWD